jgi:hypothetical protein
MQISAHLTKGDYSKFCRYSMLRLHKLWLMCVPSAAFFCWIVFPKDYAEHGMSFAFASGFALLIGLIVSGLLSLSMGVTAILLGRRGTVLGEHTFTLTDSEFQEVNAVGATAVKLDVLRRYETAQHVFLLTARYVGYILPMRDLHANPEFLRVLRERTKEA